jgi:hypothetical protein
MAKVAVTMTAMRDRAGFGRGRAIGYWAATVLIAWELVFGGIWDILRIPYVYDVVVVDLGYPEYFLVVLGAWKVLGGIALLVPAVPLLKEWAYAGAFSNYTGAVASHIAVGDGIGAWWGPAGFAAILMASWALRPATRTLRPLPSPA